jgi:hypothetical protein
MHVQLTEHATSDALDDGKVTIDRTDYAAGAVGDKLGDYEVDPEIKAAIEAYPSHYRAGVLGPDAYPDIITGQQVIHPDSKEWLQHLWKKADQLAAGTVLRAKAKAWVAGFLTHADGDMYAHTFINYWNGSELDSADDAVPGKGDFTLSPKENGIRHVVSEGYAAKKGPAAATLEVSIDGLEDWIYQVMINGDNPDTYEQLMTTGSGAPERKYSIPVHLASTKHWLKGEIAWYYRQKSWLQDQVDDAGVLDYLYWLGRLTEFVATWGSLTTYYEAWRDDIGPCMEKWPKFNHDNAVDLLLGGDHKNALNRSAEFVSDCLLAAMGFPKALGFGIGVAKWADEFFEIQWIRDLQAGFLQWMFQRYLGSTVDEWLKFVDPASALFNAIMGAAPPPNDGRNVTAANFEANELKLGGAGSWDYKKFVPAWNTVQMNKILLLGPDGLKKLAGDLGYKAGTVDVNNAMLGFIRTLDGSNRWWKDAPRAVIARDFCHYKKIFMRQTGEATAAQWVGACAGADCCPESDCGDGADNDGDGLSDCADADCAGTMACPGSEWLCDDGLDDDGDGSSDCDDPDCEGDPNCPSCGDNWCDAGESCATCAPDCGSCASCEHSPCTSGSALNASCSSCTQAVCDLDPNCCEVQWESICVQEAQELCPSICPLPATSCGDLRCNGSENCSTCPFDCGPCASCGNGVCEQGECGGAMTCGTCSADCGGGCPPCGRDVCIAGDVFPSSTCSACVTSVCAADPYCCSTAWDALCVSMIDSLCGLTCATRCGDNQCDSPENDQNCPNDCAETASPIPASLCPNGACEPGESCGICAEDCGSCPTLCGNGVCESGETCYDCDADCGDVPPCTPPPPPVPCIRNTACGSFCGTMCDGCGGTVNCGCPTGTVCGGGGVPNVCG